MRINTVLIAPSQHYARHDINVSFTLVSLVLGFTQTEHLDIVKEPYTPSHTELTQNTDVTYNKMYRYARKCYPR